MVFRILSMDFVNNKTVMNELDCMESNLDIVREMKFPNNMPVLQFVSGRHGSSYIGRSLQKQTKVKCCGWMADTICILSVSRKLLIR